VVKDDGKPYTVFTPYKNKWYQKLNPFYLKAYPTEKYLANLYPFKAIGLPFFKRNGLYKKRCRIPRHRVRKVHCRLCRKTRFPGYKGTSHIGLHLRFGTVSIRQWPRDAHGATKKPG
jgi:deoxyribodipyrimidine photo-lyase